MTSSQLCYSVSFSVVVQHKLFDQSVYILFPEQIYLDCGFDFFLFIYKVYLPIQCKKKNVTFYKPFSGRGLTDLIALHFLPLNVYVTFNDNVHHNHKLPIKSSITSFLISYKLLKLTCGPWVGSGS